MQLKIVEMKEIEEGKHTGKITRLAERLEPYHYLDVFVQLDGTEIELKYGCPVATGKLSTRSKLFKLLSQFAELKEGDIADPEKILVGKNCAFITLNEDTDKGTFARIAENSIKALG